MEIEYAWRTHPGKIRSNNEDNLFADGVWLEGKNDGPSSHHTFAVCDGMGGASYGEVASLLAMRVLAKFEERDLIDPGAPDVSDRFNKYINAANDVVCEEMRRRSVSNMGAAVAVLTIDEDRAAICNLGDCRIYRYDADGLKQLSEDHRMKAAGLGGTVLSQHLGVPADDFILEPYIETDVKVRPGQIFLLCSDGLSDMVSDNGIRMVLEQLSGDTADLIAAALIEVALVCGGRDNVTVMVVKTG